MKVSAKIFLFFSCFSLLALPLSGADKTVSLVSLEYPPYCGKNIEGQGFTTEIVKGAFAQSGYEVTIKFKPWKRALEETKTGKFDGVYQFSRILCSQKRPHRV